MSLRAKAEGSVKEPKSYMKYYDMGYDPRLIKFSWPACTLCGRASEFGDVVLISPRAETLCSWVCVDKWERAIAKQGRTK